MKTRDCDRRLSSLKGSCVEQDKVKDKETLAFFKKISYAECSSI